MVYYLWPIAFFLRLKNGDSYEQAEVPNNFRIFSWNWFVVPRRDDHFILPHLWYTAGLNFLYSVTVMFVFFFTWYSAFVGRRQKKTLFHLSLLYSHELRITKKQTIDEFGTKEKDPSTWRWHSGKQMQLQCEELCVIHNRFVDVMIYIWIKNLCNIYIKLPICFYFRPSASRLWFYFLWLSCWSI